MRNVDVIFTGTLNSIIGPVQTIKRIRNNHDYFFENGYDVTIFTSDNLATPRSISASWRHMSGVRVKPLPPKYVVVNLM